MSDKVALLVGQRQSGESDNAVIACNDWLRLGPGRSLPILAEKYADFYQGSPPTQSYGTLKVWSSKFNWEERADDFDASWEERKTEEHNAEFNHGLALDYERVRKLKRLAAFLESQIYEQGVDGVYHNVWLPDVKQIGGGEYAERVDIERFNGSLIQQYRDVLDDIAEEVGGRVKKQEVTGADGGAIQFEDVTEGARKFDVYIARLIASKSAETDTGGQNGGDNHG